MINPTSRLSTPISVPRFQEPSSYSAPSHIGGIVSPQIRSKSIPISSSHFHRTASEIQLYLDEQIAEQRDYVFYSRLVNGIRNNQSTGQDHFLQRQNEKCLTHIIQTRTGDQAQQQIQSTFLASTQPNENEDWSVGLAIDYPSTPHASNIQDSDDGSPLNQSEEQAMIFDLDL